MAEPSAAMEFLGRIAYEFTRIRPLLPTYLHLLVSAVFPIYTGAHASLSRPSSAGKAESEVEKSKRLEDDGLKEVTTEKMEGLTTRDALAFPLLAGATLTSLYFILKWLKDPEILNKILGYYFGFIGFGFGVKFLIDFFHVTQSIILPAQYSANGGVFVANNNKKRFEASSTKSTASGVHQPSPLPGMFRSLPIPDFLSTFIWQMRNAVYSQAKMKLHLHGFMTLIAKFGLLDFLSVLVTAGVTSYQTFVGKPWFLTNFLGFSFCYGSLQLMSPTTSWTGTILLSGLFVYDIYMVFFTPMMVTVATQLDVPIKLLFPRPDGCVLPVGAAEGSALMNEYLDCIAKKRTMAMLGLGDIVIPGMMVAFALRFDLYLFYARQQKLIDNDPVLTEKYVNPNEPKPKYLPATGGWGERFWTERNLETPEVKARRFPKTYFHASLMGYLAGLITTLLVMQIAEHAQPALLYLVPGVLGSIWGTAFVKGDLKTLWNYDESDDGDDTWNVDNDKEHKVRIKAEKEEEEAKKDREKSKKKRKCRDLISFSITLPPLPDDVETEEDGSTDLSESGIVSKDLAEAMNGHVGTNGDASPRLPDAEADEIVLERIERSISKTPSQTDGAGDYQPAGKRQRRG